MATTWTAVKLINLSHYAPTPAWHQQDAARTRCGAMIELLGMATDVWFATPADRDAWLTDADQGVLALIDPDGRQHLVTFNLDTGTWQPRLDPQTGRFLPPTVGTGPQFS